MSAVPSDSASTLIWVAQSDAVKQSVRQAIANFRELAEMEAQSRSEAWAAVQDRMQENLPSLPAQW